MLLARVVGDVVSTVRNRFYKGHKLLMLENINLQGETVGNTYIGIDKVDAGPGDLVLVNREGSGARQLLNNDHIPIQSVIVGVVDGMHVEENE